jgi:hypothetical protein
MEKIMSNLEQKTVEILDKLDAAISHYSPQVYDAAVAAVQVSAIGELIIGFFFLIPLVFSVKFARVANSYFIAKNESERFEGWDTIQVCVAVVYAIIYAICLIVAINHILDAWNWVAIFNPKLALAHKIMGL